MDAAMKADCGPNGHSRRAVVLGLAAATMPLGSLRAETPQSVTDRVVGDHFRVNLIDAGPWPGDPHRRLAGIAVELDPGYLTYWRSPGEAGVPPSLDTAGSVNLKSATLLFPAPRRFSESGAEAFGYKDAVLFPVDVLPTDPGTPVDLHAAFAFAICERLCLPANATLRLALDGDGQGAEAAQVRDALARVPKPAELGAPGPLAVTAVQGTSADAHLTVLVHTTGADAPALFAEAPDPWFVRAGAGLWLNNGTLKYRIDVLARPPDPAPLPLRLTLVGMDDAIEVPVTLDAPPPKP